MRSPVTSGRSRRPSRASALAVLAWTLAAVAGGAIAAQALAAVDAGGRGGVLSESEVTAALVAANATATPAPTAPARAPVPGPSADPTPAPAPSAATPAPTPVPTTATTETAHPRAAPSTPSSAGTSVPPAPAPPPTVVARTWTVPGGIVAVSCAGTAITLLYATPSDGWTVELGSTGPQHVEVQLHRDGAETQLTGTCVAGTPQSRLETEGDRVRGRTGSSEPRRAHASPGRRRLTRSSPPPEGAGRPHTRTAPAQAPTSRYT